MALAPETTFAYAFEVSDNQAGPIEGELQEVPANGARRLVGHAPVLTTTECQRQPWQLYARITLTASDKPNATVRAASFSVDRELIRVLKRGDLLYISRTHRGGIGLSIL